MSSYVTHIGDCAGYLAEFMWRHKYSDIDKFHQLLIDINDNFTSKYLKIIP